MNIFHLKNVGKILFIIGIFLLFRNTDGGNGFGGPIDFSFQLLILSLFFMVTGLVLFSINKNGKK